MYIFKLKKLQKHGLGQVGTSSDPYLLQSRQDNRNLGSTIASVQVPWGSGSHVSINIPSVNPGAQRCWTEPPVLKTHSQIHLVGGILHHRVPSPKVTILISFPLSSWNVGSGFKLRQCHLQTVILIVNFSVPQCSFSVTLFPSSYTFFWCRLNYQIHRKYLEECLAHPSVNMSSLLSDFPSTGWPLGLSGMEERQC